MMEWGAACDPLQVRGLALTAPELQIQDPSESGIDASHEFPGNWPHPAGETGFVERHDLSDVSDGVLWERRSTGYST